MITELSIKETIISQLEEVRRRSTGPLRPLTDDLVLLDSGLDSLGLAILVTRLEDSLGVDPFTDSNITVPPVTLGDFIQLYESAGQSRDVDQG
jgi:acyl carrier protein